MAGIVVTIGGTSRAFEQETLAFDLSMNGRDTLAVTLRAKTGDFEPIEGQALVLEDNGVAQFGGIIQRVSDLQEGESDFLIFEVEAEDYAGICDRHLVAKVYEDQTLQAIVQDIVDTFLPGESITYAGVETGPTIEKAVFNYGTATQAFNDLAELSGMAWWIDASKDLQFRARDSITGTAITDTNYVTLSRTKAREDYRNRQYLRAGTDLTAALPEILAGDGQRQVFTVSLPVGKTPTVETNIASAGYVSKTVGLREIDTGKDFYWNKGKTEISQDSGGALLTAADLIRVTYQGQFPIIVQADDDAAIAVRAALEGGTGIHEAREDRPDIDDIDLAIATAEALLDRHGAVGCTYQVETLVAGYKPGQLVGITNARRGLTGETFLISSVRGTDWLGQDQRSASKLRYSLTLLEGDPIIGWRDFYRKLLASRQAFVVRDNEVLQLLKPRDETVTCTDELTASSDAAESRAGFALAGYSEAA